MGSEWKQGSYRHLQPPRRPALSCAREGNSSGLRVEFPEGLFFWPVATQLASKLESCLQLVPLQSFNSDRLGSCGEGIVQER